MTKFKKTLVWSMIHGKPHPTLTQEERKISGSMPLIDTLFPGINYYSISGFHQVTNDYVRPALKKLFPDLEGLGSEKVRVNGKVQIDALLPSNGYEHLNDPQWKRKLEKLIQA